MVSSFRGFPGGSGVKESACNAGDPGLIPGLRRFPGEGNGNPLQYSCLEKSHGQRSLVRYSPWSCRVIYDWTLVLFLLAWEMSAIVRWFEHSLVLTFLGIGMRIDLFQTCGHCWVLQICWYIEYNTLIASFFRVLNSPTGIPSHLLALLTAVLLKAHLTSHSRMSGSGWQITS